ncbi:MAG TPA: tRNA 2-thiouridine(34) synthase MnmA, partial [Sorangium sp.]|nr:tRNA 2-thiouridine(34) synthase MnmA [Sorangium sp.]
MSGGVDSALAAALLVDDGWEVVGVTLHLWDYPDDAPEKTRCCAPEDAHDARLVADHLGIPHYTFDRRELFQKEVVGPFVDAYLAGTTPSPCVWCNRSVKMHELFGLADRLGAHKIATGHYARVVHDSSGRARLYRARDERKDQSYFLHMLGAAELDRLVLPLADLTKDEVRADAIARDLPGAHKGESQELCFVAAGKYADFVEQRADGRVRPGPILSTRGETLGQHHGIHRFTVGQRRGLGVALGKPAFVARLDATTAAVVVGEADDTLSIGAELHRTAWADDAVFPLRVHVKVRSHQRPVPATVVLAAARTGEPALATVQFDTPVRA